MAGEDGPSYAVGTRNRVNRYRNRAVYDYDFVHGIVNNTAVVHVAFPPSLEPDADPFPAQLPMIGCMARYTGGEDGNDENDKALDLYLHGYVSSRIMRLSTSANESTDDGLPLTVSATVVDGLVLSLTPNSHSYNYRSVVLHGYGTLVTDTEEKLWAMHTITNKVFPQRWENTRTPPTPTEMKTTNILRVRIVSASGKRRHGEPHDDRHDMKDTDMRSKVWTGVVPVWQQFGAPQKASTEDKTKIPSYITEALKQKNQQQENEALAAMKE